MLPGAAPAAPEGATAGSKPKSAHKAELRQQDERRQAGQARRRGGSRERRRATAHAQRQVRAAADFRRRQRDRPSTSCNSPAKASPIRRSAASSTSLARRRSRRPMLAARTASSASRPRFPPARSRSTFLTARFWCRAKSPPACSRPPIAKRRPADCGVPTARRWSAMRPRSSRNAPRRKGRWANSCTSSRTAPRTARRRRTSCAIRTDSPGSATSSAATTRRKASTATAPCASPRRERRFCGRGSMSLAPQPRQGGERKGQKGEVEEGRQAAVAGSLRRAGQALSLRAGRLA